MTTVKGFKDFSGKEAEQRSEMKKVLVETFESFGFQPAETPIIEYEKFVKGENKQDKVISDIFKLRDKGKRKLALRYEFTFQLKRLMQNKKLPYKRYQIGEVFRDEPVSANRFRQFTQCDVDTIGSDEKSEAELLAVVKKVLDTLNIKFTIYVNNRALLNEILRQEKITKTEETLREIDKLDKLPETEIKKNLKKYNAEKIINILKKPEKFFEKYAMYSEIKKLKQYCKLYGVEVKFSPTLARGLSYYNGNVFEVKVKNLKETVCGGGSYKFNNKQCSGLSFGLERLAKLTNFIGKKEKFLVVSLNQNKKAIEIATKIRNSGFSADIYYGKPSKALEYANAYNINNVIFVGAKEIKKKKFKLKNMKTGREKYITIEKRNLKNIRMRRKK